jgi:2-deoxy-D-gluconate 3-dehydrogenase
LLNNVGITRWSKAEEMSEADWDIVLRVNLNSLFMAQLAGQHMLKQGYGKIVNIASLLKLARLPDPLVTPPAKAVWAR